MIEYDGKKYVLKYNMKRIELIESVTGMPTMADLKRTGGMLGLVALKTYIAYAIKEEGEDIFQPAKKGMELADAIIRSNGYADVCGMVIEAIERDCPFFFQ